VTRALVTFGVTGMEELLELAQPGLREYADRHGYTLLTEPPLALTRPPSWHKITVLLEALDEYDEALWVDCDVMIADSTLDLADEIPAESWQAITAHHTPEGEVPSAGVWYLRQPMQPVLEAIWRLDGYLHFKWWEQGALQELLGYTPHELPVHLERETELYRRTHWLGLEWHTLGFPGRPLDPGARVVHCAPGNPISVRAQLMRDLTPALKGA
jgi:hypothetical protein